MRQFRFEEYEVHKNKETQTPELFKTDSFVAGVIYLGPKCYMCNLESGVIHETNLVFTDEEKLISYYKNQSDLISIKEL